MSTTILFRTWPKKADAAYDTCAGFFQAANGDMLVMGRIPAAQADAIFAQLTQVPASTRDEMVLLQQVIQEMGVADLAVGQRCRRRTKKPDKEVTECSEPSSENQSLPEPSSTPTPSETTSSDSSLEQLPPSTTPPPSPAS